MTFSAEHHSILKFQIHVHLVSYRILINFVNKRLIFPVRKVEYFLPEGVGRLIYFYCMSLLHSLVHTLTHCMATDVVCAHDVFMIHLLVPCCAGLEITVSHWPFSDQFSLFGQLKPTARPNLLYILKGKLLIVSKNVPAFKEWPTSVKNSRSGCVSMWSALLHDLILYVVYYLTLCGCGHWILLLYLLYAV